MNSMARAHPNYVSGKAERSRDDLVDKASQYAWLKIAAELGKKSPPNSANKKHGGYAEERLAKNADDLGCNDECLLKAKKLVHKRIGTIKLEPHDCRLTDPVNIGDCEDDCTSAHI